MPDAVGSITIGDDGRDVVSAIEGRIELGRPTPPWIVRALATHVRA